MKNNDNNNDNLLPVETITAQEIYRNEEKYVGKLLEYINTKGRKQYFFFFGIRIATISSAGNSYLLYCLSKISICEFHFYDQEKFKVYNVLQ